MTDLLDFAIITIFAREVLEGGIIIGEYRTVILRSDWRTPDFTQQDALRAVTLSAIFSAAFAVVVIIAILIPLFILSREFNQKTAILIEGASKIVAAICILQLSLKMPKFFGLYYSKSQVEKLKKGELVEENQIVGLSLRSIRFNVAWNIWREVAECGVFLIPSFLSGEIKNIPLSAVTGCVVGGAICFGIYYANHRVKNTMGLTIFTVGLLVLLSTGLFSGGCHKFEIVYGFTPIIWELEGKFWSVDRLPMTIFKPFGYSDTRTVLQMATFWGWGFFSLLLHRRKYLMCRKPTADGTETRESEDSTLMQRQETRDEERLSDGVVVDVNADQSV